MNAAGQVDTTDGNLESGETIMTAEQQQRWNEADEMERKYPNDPFVLENAIRIRQEILQEMRKKIF